MLGLRLVVGCLAVCFAGCLGSEAPPAAEAPAVLGADRAVEAPPPVLAPPDAEADCTVIVSADREFGGPPLTVHFRSEVDCTAAPVTYAWDFGDGGQGSTAPHPSHTYEREGEFVAVVRVAAPDGGSSDDSIDIAVDAALDE